MATQGSKSKSFISRLFGGLVLLLLGLLLAELLFLSSAALSNTWIARWNPKTSSFMALERLENWQGNSYQWVSLNQISPNLMRAVLVAEDDAFFDHDGLDMKQMKKSWELNLKKKKVVRGGSTLTMQLVKNLYLTESRNPLRKVNEVILALDLESKASKARILELYLNMAQWGQNLFGAEAASRHYFNKSAKRLSRGEAAYLAAILPNPIYMTQGGKNRAAWRKRMILRRMTRRTLPQELISSRP